MIRFLPKYVLCVIMGMLIMSLPVKGAWQNHDETAQQLKEYADQSYDKENFAEALEFYLYAYEKSLKEGNREITLRCLGNMGNSFMNMGNTGRAIYYYKECYKMAKKLGMKDIEFNSLNNLVFTYCRKGMVAEARYYLLRLEGMGLKGNELYRISLDYNRGLLYKTEGNYAKARHSYTNVRKRLKPTDSDMKITLDVEEADILMHEKKYENSLRIYKDVLYKANKTKDMYVASYCYDNISKVYALMGDSGRSSAYHIAYMDIKDTAFNQRRFDEAHDKVNEYERMVSARSINELKEREEKITTTCLTFAVLLIFASIFGVIIARRNHKIMQQQKVLIRKNQELTALYKECDRLLNKYRETSTTRNDSVSTMPQEQQNALLAKINDVMEDIGIISRSDFSLRMLADLIGSNTTYVSRVINDTYGANFKSFLNDFRIRESCKRLCDTEHYGNMTIQSVYEELGFTSAAGFIKAFKKNMGMTPSEFMRHSREKSVAD